MAGVRRLGPARLTQDDRVRVWELRHAFTVYDAAHLAVTERLMSEEAPADVALTTPRSQDGGQHPVARAGAGPAYGLTRSRETPREGCYRRSASLRRRQGD